MAEVAKIVSQERPLHQQGNTVIQTPNGTGTNDWEIHTGCVLKTFPGPSEPAWERVLLSQLHSCDLQQAANTEFQ